MQINFRRRIEFRWFSRMPFNNDPGSIGFFITFFLEWISGYVLMMIFSSVNSFYFGISWMIETCISDLFRYFYRMDANVPKEATTPTNSTAIMREIIGFVRMHNDILGWVEIQDNATRLEHWEAQRETRISLSKSYFWVAQYPRLAIPPDILTPYR